MTRIYAPSALARALALSADDGAAAPTIDNQLNRRGVELIEIDLTDTKLLNGVELQQAHGTAIRFLRHGSNPGARLELGFSGNPTDRFWSPGKALRGNFDGLTIKWGVNCARAGKATFAIIKDEQVDFTEDLIVSAIGPVDLLGTSVPNTGDIGTFVEVAINTPPTGSPLNPVGSFDGSGWELLRVLINCEGAGLVQSFDLVPWINPDYDGVNWFHQGIDKVSVPDTETTGGQWRALTVPWGGRGLGYFDIRNLQGTGTALKFIIQGLR